MKTIIPKVLLIASLAAYFPAQNALAGECYSDPVYEKDLHGKIVIGARVRDGACMDGTTVLKTLPVGKVVKIIGETDGWYKIEDNDGTVGWVGQRLMTITDEPLTAAQPHRTPSPTTPPDSTVTSIPFDASKILSRVRGYIILQVEARGEGWYVNPVDSKRYYMKDGETAYQMMRRFGLGVSNKDLEKLKAGDVTLINRLRGRIVLQVEARGEAYYIYPKDGTLHYLKDGPAAYELMRNLGLGISNNDIFTLPSSELTPIAPTNPSTPTTPVNQGNTGLISASRFQRGVVPSKVDLIELNRYWLSEINRLRAERGLRQLVLDQRWVDTATEWAVYMGENEEMSHNRPDGKTMHQWIDAKGLPFTVRYSPNGWRTNYFTENISWDHANGSTESVKGALDNTMEFYLAEAGSNGPHYRTIYHPDWNSVGVGFYFESQGDDSYKVSMAFHYGSLVQ